MPIEDVLTAVERYGDQYDTITLARDYYAGMHRVPFTTEAYEDKFRDMLDRAQVNLCPKIVRNFADLVSIESWLGDAGAAERLAQTVPVRRAVERASREAFRAGDGYILAWPTRDGTMWPWYHRADQVVHEPDPEDPSGFLWVAKLWVTPAGVGRVNVYYDDLVERWETVDELSAEEGTQTSWPGEVSGYRECTDSDGATITNPAAAKGIPWVHLPNEADQDGGRGVSVLRDVIPIQDMLNAFVSYIAVNGEQYAAPLRYLLNYMPKTFIDPTTAQVTEEVLEFDETRKRIFGIEGEGPFGQLDPPDPTALLRVMDSFGSWMARVAGIPQSDVTPSLGDVPSGVSLRILASERTNRVRDFTADNTPAVTRLMDLLGSPGARPVWADPAPVDDAERQQMAESRHAMGWPLDENMRAQGYSPEDVQRVQDSIDAREARITRTATEAFRRGLNPADVIG